MVYVWSEWKERTTKAFSWTLAPDTSWPPVTHATTSISPRRRTLHLFSSKRKSTIRDFPSQASMTPPPDYRCTASLPAWVRPTTWGTKYICWSQYCKEWEVCLCDAECFCCMTLFFWLAFLLSWLALLCRAFSLTCESWSGHFIW